MLMKMSESSKEYSYDIVRGCFGKLCDALTVNSTVLTQCAINLFSKGLIDRSIKQCAIHTDDQLVGADTLLSCLMLRIQYNPDEFDIVLGIFSQIGALKDIAQEMKDKKEQAIDGGECASHVDQMSSDAVAKQDKVSPYRKVIPAIRVLSTDAANTLNNHLHRAFQELMSIMFNAMIGLDAQPVLISKLKFLLHVFFQCKDRNHHHYPGCKSTIEKLDSCKTASDVLTHFVKASLIGPLNYKLLDIFVDVSGNEEAQVSLKDYEEDYLALFECDFDSVIRLFKHPSTAPPYPAISLPDFTIRLGQKWEETGQGNYYTLKGLLEMKFKWPLGHMIILDMIKNCILIKYGVLPFFVLAVVRDLTNPTIIEELKKEDIIIELSPQLKDIARRYEQVQPPSSRTISSSDVTLFLKFHDLAITDGQKSQLQKITTTSTTRDTSAVQTHSDDVELPYTGRFFYSRHGDRRTINQWVIRFMAARDHHALESYFEEKFPDAEADQMIRFGFHGNNGVLELVMSHDPATPVNGWMIRPHSNPLTIRQEDMDRFGRDDGIPSPPSCLISVSTHNPDDTTPDLYYRVPVKGVVSNTKEIFINRILETTSGRRVPGKSYMIASPMKHHTRPPHEVLRRYLPEICHLLPDLHRLHWDLVEADRMSDDVLWRAMSRTMIRTRARDIIGSSFSGHHQVHSYMQKIMKIIRDRPEAIYTLCEALEKQDNESLNEVVQIMRIELGMITDDIS